MKHTNELKQAISVRLREAMERLETSGYKVAKTLKISPTTIHHITSKRSLPRIEILLMLCNELDVSLTWMLGLED